MVIFYFVKYVLLCHLEIAALLVNDINENRDRNRLAGNHLNQHDNPGVHQAKDFTG